MQDLPRTEGVRSDQPVGFQESKKPPIPVKTQLLRLTRNFFIIYLLLAVVLVSPLYSFIVLRPEGPSGPAAGLYKLDRILNSSREEFYFPTANGQKLHGWLFRTPGSDRVMLVHHGNAGNILHRLFIAKHGILAGNSVFLYDYRGYGKSEGHIAITNLPEDGLAARDFVGNTLKFNHILNYGESIGTAVATQVSRERPCDGTIIQSGLCSLPAVAKDGLFFMHLYPDSIFPKPHFSNLDIVKDLHKPILVVHGTQDKQVPYQHGEKIFALANEPKQLVLLTGCGHNDVGLNDEALFDKSIQNFMTVVYGTATAKSVDAKTRTH